MTSMVGVDEAMGADSPDRKLETDMELDYELTWYESEELSWWAEHPTATEAEFEAVFYGEYQ